ncbi:hypothetical protein AFGD_011356 [Aspergillus flavus]|nr:hypothetical protein AFGD_011356 [Aspergillus flavus]
MGMYINLTLLCCRRRLLHNRYSKRYLNGELTDNDAWEILTTLGQLEFPAMFQIGLEYALFRTYAIPTISRVLLRKSDFASPKTWYKRYSDTVALMVEALANPPASRRGHEAIARVKYLHHAYRESGSIMEDDMLYTLGLLTIEPAKWIDRYEWDQTSQMEKCAMGTYWKSFGDAMEVSYDSLPSGKKGFKDGLQFFEEIEKWCRDYEIQAMPHHPPGISDLQDQLIRNVALNGVPKILHNLARSMILVLMDDQLRLSQPAPWVYALTHTVLVVRKYILRYLVLPRPLLFRQLRVNPDPEERSPHRVRIWEAYPYYVAPTLWNRWGPYAWITWAQGRPLPGDDGDSKNYLHQKRAVLEEILRQPAVIGQRDQVNDENDGQEIELYVVSTMSGQPNFEFPSGFKR